MSQIFELIINNKWIFHSTKIELEMILTNFNYFVFFRFRSQIFKSKFFFFYSMIQNSSNKNIKLKKTSSNVIIFN